MPGFTKLFSSIVDSTIWREDDKTRLVWVTMLAKCDRWGRVMVSVPGLADAARVTLEECVAAITKLSAPDTWSRSKEWEGRRVEEIDGGFRLLNYVKYREIREGDERREQVRAAVARHRAKRSNVIKDVIKSSVVIPGKPNAEAEAEAEKNRSDSSEPQAASEPTVYKFEVVGNGSRVWGVLESAHQKLATAFPGVDVTGEYAKAYAWLAANESKRKTARGMPRFLFGWMERAQNRGGSTPSNGHVRPALETFAERDERRIRERVAREREQSDRIIAATTAKAAEYASWTKR